LVKVERLRFGADPRCNVLCPTSTAGSNGCCCEGCEEQDRRHVPRAFFDFSDLSPEKAAAISEFTIDEYKDGGGEEARDVRKIRFKLHDKRASLETLAKLCGFMVEKRDIRLRSLRDLTDAEVHSS
jgi:hypothetical protein